MSEDHWRAVLFLGEVDSSLRPRFEAVGEAALDALLVSANEAGAAAWPHVTLTTERFVRHLAASADDTETSAGPVDPAFCADLYLACAAAYQDLHAIATIERELVAKLVGPLRSTGLDRHATDDVLQRVREFLFVSAEGLPGIANYRARGSLRGWIRAVALRQAMMSFRGRREHATEDSELEAMPAIANNPELAPWKNRYAAAFRIAFAQAVAELSDEERTLLRQHHIDRLSIDALSSLHRVHRATAARWLSAARAKLLAGVRTRMVAELAISGSELDSALRMARSHLDISIHRVLGEKRRRDP